MKRILGIAQDAPSSFVLVSIGALYVAFIARNSAFIELPHQFAILRSSIVIGIMALGLLLVLISGGIDVSFTAVAVLSMYSTVQILNGVNYGGPIVVAFLIAAAIGGLLGLLNGALISLLRLPTLIVTLATLTLFRGFMLFFIGTDRIRELPAQMKPFARSTIVSVATPNGGKASLHVGILLLVGLALAVAVLLRWTPFGRAIYAIGGNRQAAERAGLPIRRVELGVYGLAGSMAGIAGVVDAALIRAADPFTIVGTELDVLAAVVIGGAAITGGRGGVLGTFLGVILIALVDSSLVLAGIPTEWQKLFVGLFILAGVMLPALRTWSTRTDPRTIE